MLHLIHTDYQDIVLSIACLLLYFHLYLLGKIINNNTYLIEDISTKNIWLNVVKVINYTKIILILLTIYFYILSLYKNYPNQK